MTLREQLQAKLDSLKAQQKAIEEHLAMSGAELDQEESVLIAWAESVIAKVKALL